MTLSETSFKKGTSSSVRANAQRKNAIQERVKHRKEGRRTCRGGRGVCVLCQGEKGTMSGGVFSRANLGTGFVQGRKKANSARKKRGSARERGLARYQKALISGREEEEERGDDTF